MLGLVFLPDMCPMATYPPQEIDPPFTIVESVCIPLEARIELLTCGDTPILLLLLL